MASVGRLQSFLLFACIVPAALSATLGICDGTNTTWICIQNYPIASIISSAWDTAACFCVGQQKMTQTQAYTYCDDLGGFLTDIKSSLENLMMSYIMGYIYKAMPPNPQPCGPGAQLWMDGRCYAYIQTKMKWDDAEKYCETQFQGTLATIVNKTHQDWMFQNLSQKCAKCDQFGYWVGGHNHPPQLTNWTWIDETPMNGTPVVTQHKGWKPQPDHPDKQNCMTCVKVDGGWGDWRCEHKQPFVCGFDVPAIFPSWIGLQRTASGHSWYIGPNGNCAIDTPSYLNLKTSSESPTNVGYVYTQSTVWKAVPATWQAGTAICRMEQDICQRTPTCASGQTCTPAGNKCWTCA